TIAITHCGHEADKELAKKFHGALAAIVGGHSHRALEPSWYVPEGASDAVLIVQTGAKTANLGRVDLDIDRLSRRVLRARGRLIPVLTEASDPAIKAMVDVEVAEC